MIEILIDSAYLACPQSGLMRQHIDDYVERLISLNSLIQTQSANLLISGLLLQVLDEAAGMPPYGPSEVDHYIQRQDVLRLFYSCVSRAHHVEDISGVREVLLDNTVCQPDDFLLMRPVAHVSEYFRCTAMLCLAAALSGSTDVRLRVLTPDIDVVQATLNGQIVDIEFQRGETALEIPFDYSGQITNAGSVTSLANLLDPIELWRHGFVEHAINLSVFQQLRRNGDLGAVWPVSEQRFSLLAKFATSVERLGLVNSDSKLHSVLRACTDVIVDRESSHSHILRIDAGGNSDPRIRSRDGATAWRHDVDYEYHLHYWRTAGGRVEFACVVVHNNFSIEE